jgi:hypothetical protein
MFLKARLCSLFIQVEGDFVIELKFVIFKFRAVTCCSLNFMSQIISQYFAHCQFWNAQGSDILLVPISLDREQKPSDFIRLSFNDCSVTAASPFTNVASLAEPLTPTANGRFHWRCRTKLLK